MEAERESAAKMVVVRVADKLDADQAAFEQRKISYVSIKSPSDQVLSPATKLSKNDEGSPVPSSHEAVLAVLRIFHIRVLFQEYSHYRPLLRT